MALCGILNLYTGCDGDVRPSTPQRYVAGQRWPAVCLIESLQDVEYLFAASRLNREVPAAVADLQHLEHLELHLDAKAVEYFCSDPCDDSKVGQLLVVISSLTISGVDFEMPEEKLHVFLLRLNTMFFDVVEPSQGMKLCLEKCKFSSIHSFWGALARCPPFETLAISDVQFTSSYRANHANGEAILESPTQNQLQIPKFEIRISAGSQQQVESVEDILSARGASIEDLVLSIRGSFDHTETEAVATLFAHDDLHFLEITVDPPDDPAMTNHSFGAVVDVMVDRCESVLSLIDVDKTRCISFIFVVPAGFTPDAWVHIDARAEGLRTKGELAGIDVDMTFDAGV
ncbi:hypothetical protein OBBRIDRAFT_858930 [Obba rivulosa]|uniref:Uncharacterized protein n=1 Tax=Obba rivulosa TaxID=1052685 RepID=A0A8E2DPR6_9APHY|nr:hypothetical protein OBBRIDRAFT_858930 [Obba rivulosa]